MIVQSVPVTCKFMLLDAVARDRYFIALYTSAADLSEHTSTPPYEGEAKGPGYTSGGLQLQNPQVRRMGKGAGLTWDDPVWPVATITARGALIYNATRKDAAVAVLDFGEDVSSTNGPFTVRLPADLIAVP